MDMSKIIRPLYSPLSESMALPIVISILSTTVIAILNRHFQLDDALIYYRYIENALNGHGLVYNIGERHNALTSPFFTYIFLALSALFGGHIHAAAIVLSASSQLFLIIALLYCLRSTLSRWQLVFVPLLVSGSYYFCIVYGMETMLYLCLSFLCFYLFEKQRWAWLGIAATLLILTRSETVFLILALGLEHRLRRMPFPEFKAYLIPALIFISHFAFNYLYYNSFFPHSANVKTTQALSGLWGEGLVFLNIDYMPGWFFAGKQWVLYLVVGSGILGLWGLRKALFPRPWLIFLALYSTFYVGFNIPNYHWYYAPYMMTLILGHIGFLRFFSQNRLQKALVAVFIIALLSANITVLHLNRSAQRPVLAYSQIGGWINKKLPLNATIGVVEIGHIGWYSKRHIIDMIGLVTPLNAEWLAERDFSSWITHYQPDYILAHNPLFPHEAGLNNPEVQKMYQLVNDFPFQGFTLWKHIE